MRSALGVAGALRPACACLLFAVCQAVTVSRTGSLHGRDADIPSVAPGDPTPNPGKQPLVRPAAQNMNNLDGLRIYVRETCPYVSEANKFANSLVTPDICRQLGTSRPYDGTGERIHPGEGFQALTMASYGYRGLWDSDEHSIRRYFMVRLNCGQDLVRVDTPEKADLCFPSCDKSCGFAQWVFGGGNNKAASGFCTHQLPFEVPRGKEAAWGGCEHIGLFSEGTAVDPCQVVIPYYHSVIGLRAARELEDPHLPRENLLIFAGHSCRGNACQKKGEYLKSQALTGWDRREVLLAEMTTYAKSIDPDNKRHVFVALSMTATDPHADKIGANSNFLSKAWDGYARSMFSLQPQGDTPTRRAFYDAWLFGAIPVVTYTSALIYRRLLSGLMFKEVPFEDIFVVFPDDASGKQVLDMLLSFSADEIERRRALLMGLRHYIMWDWNSELCDEKFPDLQKPFFCGQGISEYDALMTGLRALRTGPSNPPG